jgi:hypothetical protein
MLKINATVRAAVRQVLSNSREYDASTLRISRDGVVSALKDADKTFAGNDRRRYVVGHVDEIVDKDGSIREGY